MAKVEKTMEVLKEISEIGDFAVALIKVIKEKGDYTSLIPELVAAVEGVGDIPTEIKDTKALAATGFYIGNEILQVFLPATEEASAEAAAE